MSFSDHFSQQAIDYAQYRPRYPANLFDYLATLTPQHNIAWDCATGNGQAALNLATLYNSVDATDASQQQISSAATHKNVRYQVCEATKSPFPDHHFDLITVAQALHWFDLEKFYSEVKRVSKLHGVFAAWCYDLFKVTPEIDTLIQSFHDKTLGSFWPDGREHIAKGYASLAFPFERISPPDFFMEATWSLSQVLGYLNTWSAVHYYIEQHGENPISQLTPQLKAHWGNPAECRDIRWPIYLHVGKVNK